MCTDQILYEYLTVKTNKQLDSFEICAKKTLMASRIKRYFKRSISDPSYKLCRDRLMNEFEKM